MIALWSLAFVLGVALIVWGAELFAEHLSRAAVRLGVSTFALGLLLAGAEPEELATVVTASLRHSPGIALGDAVGANVALALVAVAVGVLIAPQPLPARIRPYGTGAVPLGIIAALLLWDGGLGRATGGLLIGLYIAYVGVVWAIERAPPMLGEIADLRDAARTPPRRVGRELGLVFTGIGLLAIGSLLLVEAVRGFSGVEETQTRLALTLVGFATAFELVVLAWSSARRGQAETLWAAVIGSFAYNATLTLGAGAVAHPLAVLEPSVLRPALVAMPLALIAGVLIGSRGGPGARWRAAVLMGLYATFVVAVFTA